MPLPGPSRPEQASVHSSTAIATAHQRARQRTPVWLRSLPAPLRSQPASVYTSTAIATARQRARQRIPVWLPFRPKVAGAVAPCTGTTGQLFSFDVGLQLPVAGTYANGDYVGQSGETMIELANLARCGGGSGVIESVSLICNSNQQVIYELWLFDTPLAAAPIDNARWNPAAADIHKVIAGGVITLSQWYTATDTSMTPVGPIVASKPALGLSFKCALTSQSLYAALVVRGTPTLAYNDLLLRFLVTQN